MKQVVHVFWYYKKYINSLVQDCSISIADSLEILQSGTKAWYCYFICDEDKNIVHDTPGWDMFLLWIPGGRLNKKDSLTRYGNSHVKDKTS